MELIEYKGKQYPKLQAEGFAAKFAFPLAKEFCKGDNGLDIGYNRSEWCLPGAIGIDEGKTYINLREQAEQVNALNFAFKDYDYIFSSHCLEHIQGRFQDAVEYWISKVKQKGIVFLYLPNCEHQKYWAWGNKKHIHYLTPDIIQQYCEHLQAEGIISDFFVTQGYDLNGSFYCVIER